jgi:hypothetical protein
MRQGTGVHSKKQYRVVRIPGITSAHAIDHCIFPFPENKSLDYADREKIQGRILYDRSLEKWGNY